MGFVRKHSKEQAELLRKLVKLDFTEWDAERHTVYEKRADVNHDIKRLDGLLDSLPVMHAAAPGDPISAQELIDELSSLDESNRKKQEQRRRLGELRENAMRRRDQIEALLLRIAGEEEDLERIAEKGKALSAEVKAAGADVDTQAIKNRLANVEAENAKRRQNLERTAAEQEHEKQVGESDRLTDYIAEIDAAKADAFANARYPIEGLLLNEDGLFLDGVPFEQGSEGEQLLATVAIGLALRPELKVMMIPNSVVLDDENREKAIQLCLDAGVQPILEVAGNGDGCTLVIEDGQVAEQEKASA